MTDLERLDEALRRWEGWELGDPFDAMTLDVLLEAARALANGERVEWCEVHRSPFDRKSAHFCEWAMYRGLQSLVVVNPCRVVSRLLVDPPKEEKR